MRSVGGFLCATAMFAVVSPVAAIAQAPELAGRPVRLIVPYPPGAANDTAARLVASAVQGLGSVIVENKPGGEAAIGAEFVKQAAADGHSILVAPQGYAIRAAMSGPKSLRYDIVHDFEPVIYIARVPFFLVVNQDTLPMTSPRELAEYTRAHPGEVSYGSAGNGSPHHLLAEIFKLRTGADVFHVPYKGLGAGGITDLVTGRIQMVITGYPAVASHMKTGKLRILAVATADRTSLNPGVPTFKELGIDGLDVDVWLGLLAPKGTPRAVIVKLNQEFNQTLLDPAVIEKLHTQGMDPVGGTPEDFGARIRADVELYESVIKKAKLSTE